MRRLVLVLAVSTTLASGWPAAAQDPASPPRSFVDVLDGTERASAPAPVDPAATREGWIHAGRVVAGRYQARGPFEVEALQALGHDPDRRLRVRLVLRARLNGTFARAASRDPRLAVLHGPLDAARLEVEATLDAAGATDDVRARLVLAVDLRLRGRVVVPRAPAWLTLDLVVGRDPVDIGQDIVRWGRWRWRVAGEEVTDWERWDAGQLPAAAIRTANCYQFVKFLLAGAGVPERERPQPLGPTPTGELRPTIEEAAPLRAGRPRGSREVDAASLERGLRDYVRQFAGHYVLAGPGHRPARGDLVLFYVRDGSGFLQASHVGMYTGEGTTMVHNAGRGPSRADARSLLNRLRYDAIATFRFAGAPGLERR